ncbi:hypothetical protein [Nonomuraea dietziae]|uniref:hypothetical protein n=1 Tax=Nonomuraea dietziae TaxID=65515 RepID=UPI0031D7B7FE
MRPWGAIARRQAVDERQSVGGTAGGEQGGEGLDGERAHGRRQRVRLEEQRRRRGIVAVDPVGLCDGAQHEGVAPFGQRLAPGVQGRGPVAGGPQVEPEVVAAVRVRRRTKQGQPARSDDALRLAR